MTAFSRQASVVVFGLVSASLAVAIVALVSPPGARRAKRSTAERMRLAERLYREGVLPSGRPLRGVRPDGEAVVGRQAACVTCHRPSGMGTVEGDRIVPPIAGPYLFESRARVPAELDGRHTRGLDLAHAFGRNRPRPPYSESTLRRAIRDGLNPAGNAFDALMPRYTLSEADAQLVVDYLRQLSNEPPPGVTPDTLHFATVVAPGVDPKRRQALLDVLEASFARRNAANRLARLREKAYPASVHGTYRTWKLHVWDLTGASETWQAQLTARAHREPVFALVSGLSDGAWAPVEAFCEAEHVPCWFPSVNLPVSTSSDFYSVYFSGGVRLEAELAARQLVDTSGGRVRRVIQVRADDAAARGAAHALTQALAKSELRVEEHTLRSVGPAALREALAGATATDAIVLWLRPEEVAQLGELPIPPGPLYFSATLGGAEHLPLPPAWKVRARLLYPFQLPERRGLDMARFHDWMETHGLPIVDERTQADAYLASLLLSQKVDELREDLLPDYLLERAEGILGLRVPTAIYPRLSLGPAQRFASKGGYIARFATPDGSSLQAETDWIVP
jgi:mono/diheme cytochrome c family protein